MRKIPIIISLLIFPLTLIAQDINGKFFDDVGYFFKFENDKISLKVRGNGGLIVSICASGNYEIYKSYLLVYAQKYIGENSSIVLKKKAGENSTLQILDKNDNILPGVSIMYLDCNEKLLGGTFADTKGIVTVVSRQHISRIRLAYVGYDELTFDFSDTLDYRIKLIDSDILENQTLVFKINSINKDSLNLTPLTTNFEYKSDKAKALIKLDNKTKKYHFAEQIFKAN